MFALGPAHCLDSSIQGPLSASQNVPYIKRERVKTSKMSLKLLIAHLKCNNRCMQPVEYNRIGPLALTETQSELRRFSLRSTRLALLYGAHPPSGPLFLQNTSFTDAIPVTPIHFWREVSTTLLWAYLFLATRAFSSRSGPAGWINLGP